MKNVKYIGASRRVDDLGRVHLWKEVRKMLEIHEGDPYRVGVTEDGYVVIAKYTDEGGEGWKNVDIGDEEGETIHSLRRRAIDELNEKGIDIAKMLGYQNKPSEMKWINKED